MSKQVQIPEDLFLDLVTYFELTEPDEELYTRCRNGLDRKLEALAKRELYSNMHNQALTPAERERARQAYLDSKGITSNYRWSAEVQSDMHNRGK